MEHYKKALEQIANPVKFLTEEAEKQGNKLNGGMAVAISNDPIWLREIARNALMYNPVNEDKKAPVESIEEQMNKPRFELHPAWSEDEYILASEIWKILKSEAGTSGKKRVIEEIRKHDSNVVQRYEAMIGALEAVTDLMKLPTDEDKVEQFYEALEKYNYLKLKK